jgi:hypothetical protein
MIRLAVCSVDSWCLEGVGYRDGKRLRSLGWTWTRAPKGAGPGTWTTKNAVEALRASATPRHSY